MKVKAPRNRTLTLTEQEHIKFRQRLLHIDKAVVIDDVIGRLLNQDTLTTLPYLPAHSVDLLIADPPYNLQKVYNGRKFERLSAEQYAIWLDNWISQLPRILKPTASLYVCCDWRFSGVVHDVLQRYFTIRNRITWEREKGRGAKTNWKNSAEDIWFATVSSNYTFNVNSVKLKRKVIAPYRKNGEPKDWKITEQGNFRLTYPSNIWTDLTVPFWSMPENTDHPTQKPEKLIAKMVLASSNQNDVVFDPFLGSGTTIVAAKKLERRYFGIEIDREYCCLAEKRLEMAARQSTIQGYSDGVFWERNSAPVQKSNATSQQLSLI